MNTKVAVVNKNEVIKRVIKMSSKGAQLFGDYKTTKGKLINAFKS